MFPRYTYKMGIPVYFKTIVSQYHQDILDTGRPVLGTLCLDLNCLIHPCCREILSQGLSDESLMIQKILETIETLIGYTQVQGTLYIAIDGVAPKGKMKQQRQRRHKSILEPTIWDTNAISPGTFFMGALNQALIQWKGSRASSLSILISDSTEPGEGEHKILDFVKQGSEGPVAIYGLDADLIMLGMVSGVPDILLLRERTEYNIENCPNEYIYLKVDALKAQILRDLKIETPCPESTIIHDYIFLCFLLGNDFINHSATLSLRYKGLDPLLNTYRMLQKRYQGYFQLIDTDLEHLIHLPFFKEFLLELAKHEPSLWDATAQTRQTQAKRLHGQFQHEFREWERFRQGPHGLPTQGHKGSKGRHKQGSNRQNISTSRISLTDLSRFQALEPENKERRDMINQLPLFYASQERSVLTHSYYGEDSVDAVCQDYLDSLVWTSHYYFRGCYHWSWCTTYHRGPLLRDLARFVGQQDRLTLESDPTPQTCQEQLQYIFPPPSYPLQPFALEATQTKDLVLDVLFSRYLWECEILF